MVLAWSCPLLCSPMAAWTSLGAVMCRCSPTRSCPCSLTTPAAARGGGAQGRGRGQGRKSTMGWTSRSSRGQAPPCSPVSPQRRARRRWGPWTPPGGGAAEVRCGGRWRSSPSTSPAPFSLLGVISLLSSPMARRSNSDVSGTAAGRSARPEKRWIWRGGGANGTPRTRWRPPVWEIKRHLRTGPGHRVP
jgi:hypothetical protein